MRVQLEVHPLGGKFLNLRRGHQLEKAAGAKGVVVLSQEGSKFRGEFVFRGPAVILLLCEGMEVVDNPAPRYLGS